MVTCCAGFLSTSFLPLHANCRFRDIHLHLLLQHWLHGFSDIELMASRLNTAWTQPSTQTLIYFHKLVDLCRVVVGGKNASEIISCSRCKDKHICSVQHNGEAGYNFVFVNTLYLVVLKLAELAPKCPTNQYWC